MPARGDQGFCYTCNYWDPNLDEGKPLAPEKGSSPQAGKCRRFPRWTRTLDRDWCGEWAAREECIEVTPDIDPEQEIWLRNMSAAQALLVLSAETRDQVLREVLTEEERESPSPPEDFHERVQRYFAARKTEPGR
ncbi:MAG TPA: hypothetical protein VJP78_11450 [Thermoleophilia bacterium]|nr:hypothetical protein [Thermoleophilia bacterium]